MEQLIKFSIKETLSAVHEIQQKSHTHLHTLNPILTARTSISNHHNRTSHYSRAVFRNHPSIPLQILHLSIKGNIILRCLIQKNTHKHTSESTQTLYLYTTNLEYFSSLHFNLQENHTVNPFTINFHLILQHHEYRTFFEI